MKRKGPFDAKWHHHEIRLWLETKGMRKSQLNRRLAEARKELGEELHLGNVASPAFWLESASFWWTNMFLDQVYIRSVTEAAESGSRMLDYAFWNLRIGVAVSDTPGGPCEFCDQWKNDLDRGRSYGRDVSDGGIPHGFA